MDDAIAGSGNDAHALHRRVSRQRLLGLLPETETVGRTRYVQRGDATVLARDEVPQQLVNAVAASETGVIVFETVAGLTLVVPPFPVEKSHSADFIDLAPLFALLERRRAYAAFLLRRGGYTIGFFRDGYLVDSKTDRRFVKNRHRKGGQSQRRFDRIREKQVYELFEKACADMKATLEPYDAEIETLYLGGDRQALIAFRKQCTALDKMFGGRVRQRLLNIPGEPRRALLDAVPKDVWSSDVWIVRKVGDVEEEVQEGATRPGS